MVKCCGYFFVIISSIKLLGHPFLTYREDVTQQIGFLAVLPCLFPPCLGVRFFYRPTLLSVQPVLADILPCQSCNKSLTTCFTRT